MKGGESGRELWLSKIINIIQLLILLVHTFFLILRRFTHISFQVLDFLCFISLLNGNTYLYLPSLRDLRCCNINLNYFSSLLGYHDTTGTKEIPHKPDLVHLTDLGSWRRYSLASGYLRRVSFSWVSSFLPSLWCSIKKFFWVSSFPISMVIYQKVQLGKLTKG